VTKRRGDGTVERLASGRFRARKKNAAGKYQACGTYDTEDEAWAALERPLPTNGNGISLREFGDGFLLRRRSEVRDWKNDEGRWRLYIEKEPLAAVSAKALERHQVKDWLRSLQERGLAAQTQRNALNLLRVALEDMVDRRILRVNPAVGVKLSRKVVEAETDDAWEIVYPDEQIALLNAVPEVEWHTVAFALGTAVRNTEQWTIRVSDIDLEAQECRVIGWKTGKVRRIPLFGVALDAAREAVNRQKKGCPWAFPSPRTNRQRKPKGKPTHWHRWREAAGIERSVRWYDLRHTCATSLLAGWWGKQWTLAEIAQLLGHASTKTTERYAHRLFETLKKAGAGTGFHAVLNESRNSGATLGIRTPDLRFTNPRVIEGFSGLAVEEFRRRSTATGDQVAANLLEAARLLYRPGDRLAKARIRQLLRETSELMGYGAAG
jgi:integrase